LKKSRCVIMAIREC